MLVQTIFMRSFNSALLIVILVNEIFNKLLLNFNYILNLVIHNILICHCLILISLTITIFGGKQKQFLTERLFKLFKFG